MAGDLDILEDFDPRTEAEEAMDFEPVPAGWYRCRVKEAEVRTTKAGDGKYVKLRLDIEGPTHAGRVVFDQIVVSHPSEDARRIGRARFAQCCLAAGFDSRPNDTKQLLGKVVEAKLKVTRSEQYGDGNDVQAYRAPSDRTVAPPTGKQPVEDRYQDDDIPF